MKNALRLRKALVLLSLTTMDNSSARVPVRDPFFASFNELFEELEPRSRQTKSSEPEEKDLRSQAAALQAEAKILIKAADDLVSESSKPDKERNIDQALSAVHNSQMTISGVVDEIFQSAHNISRTRLPKEVNKKPKCSIHTHNDEKTDAFIVTATLPDITEEDLKITVNTTDEFGKEHQTLHVTAQQKTMRAATRGFFSTTTFSRMRNVNGRREELNIENGLVTIIIDLPQNTHTDLSEVQKTMRFEKNTLTLSFPMNKKDHKKETILRFNSKPVEITEKTDLK